MIGSMSRYMCARHTRNNILWPSQARSARKSPSLANFSFQSKCFSKERSIDLDPDLYLWQSLPSPTALSTSLSTSLLTASSTASTATPRQHCIGTDEYHEPIEGMPRYRSCREALSRNGLKQVQVC